MRRIFSLIALILGISAISLLHAQNATTLRFTGLGNDGVYVQLNRVEVKNLTRGWEETLVYPDTILMLGGVGIEDHVSVSRFALSQNTPNPFRGSSDFSLQLPENEKVNVTVYDLNGKRITDITQDLPAGIHVFRVILNTPQTYLVTASTERHSATIKIINQGSEAANRLVYLGMSSGLIQYELGGAKDAVTDHEFEQGDLMCYVGKYLANDVEYTSDTILQPQYGSQDFQLVFHCVPLNFSMFNATTCDVFTWNGQTYTQSGTYTQTFQGANGCDSIVTLNLTVGQPVTSTISDTACGSYVWTGQTYTQSGTYTQTFQAANGCDSVVTLNLTVSQPSLPVLSEVQVYGINAHTANVMASALSDSCSPVLSQGFCWSTQPNPVVSGLHTDCPVEMTTFFSGLSGLEANQTYYVRAYATNAVGIAYSSSATFTTDSYLSFTLLVDTPCTSASTVSPPSADVLDYCAEMDSVRLSIGNYQYGNIQWQYSEDMFTWTDIPGANDTVYLLQPSDECFIRARMQYPNCPPDSSQVSHIRLSPSAYAGPDRVLNEGYVTHLFGNKVDNAYCVWQVIEGDSAELDDPTDRNTAFSGPDTLYRLTWTVDNACGVSTDTVEIRYVHTVMY
nr:T9SS type A sorting domain-containing protein [Bacteroidales bacterium]